MCAQLLTSLSSCMFTSTPVAVFPPRWLRVGILFWGLVQHILVFRYTRTHFLSVKYILPDVMDRKSIKNLVCVEMLCLFNRCSWSDFLVASHDCPSLVDHRLEKEVKSNGWEYRWWLTREWINWSWKIWNAWWLVREWINNQRVEMYDNLLESELIFKTGEMSILCDSCLKN